MVLEMEVIYLKKTIIISILITIGITVLDYINLPTLLGMNISNINWDFYMGLLNIGSVLVVFAITYQTLNKREVKIHEKEIDREKNKYNISLLLLEDCYKECLSYINILNQENVDNYVVPKIDFNSTNPKIISNLQNAPFENESYLMEFVKDGQIIRSQIEGYLVVKRKFRQYVNMRIIAHDNPTICIPLKDELVQLLNTEIKEVKSLVQA
jgi:hypothetical protein